MLLLKNNKKLSAAKWPPCLSGKILLFLSLLLSSCSHRQAADLIVHNAVIYTVDSAFSTAQSFAVKDGKFIAVGSNDEILSGYEAKEMIDAKGNAVYPGLIDSHCHFYGYGEGLQQVDLVGTKSFDEVIEKIRAYVKLQKWYSSTDDHTAHWIIGRGWDQNDWTVKEFPDRKKLDSLFPAVPVFIERVDGHAALVNAEAMRRAAITEWKRVDGGRIGSYIDPGHAEISHVPFSSLNGILIDNAVDLVKKVIPKPAREEIKAALLAAQKNCFAVGLTTVDDAGLEKHIVDAMDEFQKSGELKMRIYAMLTDNKENADHYLEKGPYKTDRLDVRSFKFYADGALGSRGACLIMPYSDKPEQRGFLLSKPEHFDSAAAVMKAKGFQVNTHCIGDSAVRMISRIYLNTLVSRSTASPSPASFRWRIEHAQVVDAEDLAYFSGIIPSVQPTHATSDMYWAKDRLGAERIRYAYAYNDLLKAAGIIALGTDFPVESINPMYTFYAAVARKDLKGFPQGGFQPENALSRENTLRGMTIWGAYANFEEQEKGSIEKGKFADFVILGKDIMKCKIDSVPGVQVISTFVNGEEVYSHH
jgi:predicted amidohydrolase YtcJ